MDILKKIFEFTIVNLIKEHGHKIKRKFILYILGFIGFISIVLGLYNGFWVYKIDRIYKEIERRQIISDKIIMTLQGCNTNGIYIGILRFNHENSFNSFLCNKFHKKCDDVQIESLYEELRGILYTDKSLQPIETKYLNPFYIASHNFDKTTRDFIYNEYKQNGLAVITEEIANIYSLEYFNALYESLPVHKENKKVSKIFLPFTARSKNVVDEDKTITVKIL